VSNESARRILVDQRGELSIPFDVTGTASAPNVKPDEKYLGNLFAKAVGELLIRKPVQDVMQNTGKKILDGIFGR
jgi:hypothetical protein